MVEVLLAHYVEMFMHSRCVLDSLNKERFASPRAKEVATPTNGETSEDDFNDCTS